MITTARGEVNLSAPSRRPTPTERAYNLRRPGDILMARKCAPGEAFMNTTKLRIGTMMIALALAAGACNRNKLQSVAAPSDQTITSGIQAKLFQDPVLKTRDITVNTQ